MQTYTNTGGVSLPLALYLATDHYDHHPNTISATGIMKAIRPSVLASRVPADLSQTDIMSLVKSRTGTSIHDGLEKAWQNPAKRERSLLSLGYPKSVVDRIMVNPLKLLLKHGYQQAVNDPDLYVERDDVTDKTIPIYMEIRSFREVAGHTVGGKFDVVAEGRVRDLKTTGTFTWVNDTKTDDYQLQGSIYRWLNPKLITDDVMAVDFIFTDWAAYNVKSQKNYPAQPAMTKHIPLLSLDQTDHYIRQKLAQFDQYKTAHEADLPQCTDKELWRKEAVFKYYKSGKVGNRSTKNYPTSREAFDHLAKDGGVGIVVEKPGQVNACKYCHAFPICTQKDGLIADGSLVI